MGGSSELVCEKEGKAEESGAESTRPEWLGLDRLMRDHYTCFILTSVNQSMNLSAICSFWSTWFW